MPTGRDALTIVRFSTFQDCGGNRLISPLVSFEAVGLRLNKSMLLDRFHLGPAIFPNRRGPGRAERGMKKLTRIRDGAE
jgi:hypothetical protein